MQTFKQLFEDEAASVGPPLVFVDFKGAKVLDQSGVEAIRAACAGLKIKGKKVVLRHLPEAVAVLLDDVYRDNIVEAVPGADPTYAAAVDRPRPAQATRTPPKV